MSVLGHPAIQTIGRTTQRLSVAAPTYSPHTEKDSVRPKTARRSEPLRFVSGWRRNVRWLCNLRASSGNAALDRLALDSFEVAVAARTVPLDVRPGLACYRVSIRARRVPPFPSLGFGMRKGKVEVIYPLKRLTKVTVELVSIDHGASPQPAKIQTK
jgi:hypothetical protein